MDGDFGMRKFKRVFVQTTGLLLFFTLLCGAGYTALLTGAAQLFFPWQANGSLLLDNDEVVGSALLGQPFCGKGHLWGRMLWDSESFRQSAPDGVWLFDGQSAAQSISAPDYPAMLAARAAILQKRSAQQSAVPADLLTSSASGLDPDISLAAAAWQIPRLARETGKSEAEIEEILAGAALGRFLGLFGEPRVNVLQVNLQLEK